MPKDTKHSCKGDIIYIPAERCFYCTKCGTYIKEYTEEENELFKKLVLTSNDEKFVFDTFNTVWILKKHAVWNTYFNTYMTVENSYETDKYAESKRYGLTS